DRGDLTPVHIEGLKGMRFAPTDEMALLKSALNGDGQTADPPAVAFIAPLDPLMWDRRLLRDMWDFDYVWEVYVPEHKRRWGYYVLPILFGDRFVGRFEPRLDRKESVLRILGTWWESGFAPRQADGFVPQMRQALKAYMRFVGAKKVEWLPAASAAGRLIGSP